jgi:heptosyltransferase-3
MKSESDPNCPAPRCIIISRTDRVGDVVLTLPLLGLLRQRWPDTELVFLTRRYTMAIPEACEHVTRVIEWPDHDTASAPDRTAILADARADVMLHVFPRREIATDARRARIPRRIGTSRRWYHWLTCTERVNVTRKRSDLTEAQLNVKVAAPLLDRTDYSLDELAPFVGLTRVKPLSPRWASLLDPSRFNLLVQPMMGGTSAPWPLERYAALISALPASHYRVFITGSASETERLGPWLAALPPHVTSVAGQSLEELLAFARLADGLVAASTGPLHIAAALGIPTLALFPAGHAIRWQPVGERVDVIAAPAGPPGPDGLPRIDQIQPDAVLAVIERWRAAKR